jgi:hypothetical protein
MQKFNSRLNIIINTNMQNCITNYLRLSYSNEYYIDLDYPSFNVVA